MITEAPRLPDLLGGVPIKGTQVTLGSLLSAGRTAESSEGLSRARVQIISQAGVPRWIVPEEAWRAATVLKSWAPYRLRSRLKWKAVVAASRLNLLPLLPGVACQELWFSTTYWQQHLPGYAQSWVIVAYIGNPFPTRKALLFFVDEGAKVQAVAKVPIYSPAKQAIVNEATLLSVVRSRLLVPELIFCDEHEGIAAQTWLEGRGICRDFGPEHLDLLTRLGLDTEYVRLSDCLGPIEQRFSSFGPEANTELSHRALRFLEEPTPLRACVEHGDFTPWNLRRTRDGRLTLIDWEWGAPTGFPWQDICRFFYLQDLLFNESANVWQMLTTNPLLAEYNRRFDLSPSLVRGLTARFLLRFLCAEYEAGNKGRVDYANRKLQELLAM